MSSGFLFNGRDSRICFYYSGGDLMVLFLAKHVNYDVMKVQSKDSRWAEYMTDVEKHLTPYQYSKNPGEEFRNLLNECGFTGCDVRVLEKNFIHTTESINSMKTSDSSAMLQNVIHFICRMKTHMYLL